MPIEQQNSLGQVNITPRGEAPNLALLAIALRQGLVDKTELDPFKEAADRTVNMDTIRTLPIRRQQEMDFNTQNSQLQGIQIQGAQEQLKNVQDPLRPVQQAAEGQLVSQFIMSNPGVPIPRTADGRPDAAAMSVAVRAAQHKLAAEQENLKLQATGNEELLKNYNALFGEMPPMKGGTYDFSRLGSAPAVQSVPGYPGFVQDKTGKIHTNSRDNTTAITKQPHINNVETGLERIEKAMANLKGGLINTGPLDQYAQRFTDKGQELDAAVGQIRNSMLALTRVPGVGSQSDLEARMASMQFPSLDKSPEVNARTLENLKVFIGDLKNAYATVAAHEGGVSLPTSGGAPPATPSQGSAPEVKTKADYDALPKGTRYLWNGETRIKN